MFKCAHRGATTVARYNSASRFVSTRFHGRSFSSDTAAASSAAAAGAAAPAALSKRVSGDFDDKRPFPTQARVVIIGGGVVGCSVAYHLAKQGWGSDTVLLESGSISCGTTWHAAGLIGQMRGTASETKMSGVYGTKLYAELEAETGVATGFRRVGSLTLARTQDRLTLLKRNASRAHAYGIDAHIISGAEAGKLWAAEGAEMVTSDLTGALWLPGDGTATSTDLCASLAAGAKQNGVKIFERSRVNKIELDTSTTNAAIPRAEPRIKGVHTNRGFIECEIIVNCGGQWARQIGAMAGVGVPLHSAEHFYVVTNALNPPITPNLPVMRDPDVFCYYREWSGGLVVGGFEPVCKPCFMDGVPENFEYSLLQEDWDHFSQLMEGALERVPALQTAGVRMVNGPESFTPDNQYILGESPELRKFYVAAGFNSSGIASAGGAGRALAEWIVGDGPGSKDLWSVDIRRFGRFHSAPAFLRDRTFETLGLHYQIPWPRREVESARPARRSPLFEQLKSKGAFMGSKFGWERPNYFDMGFDQTRKKDETNPSSSAAAAPFAAAVAAVDSPPAASSTPAAAATSAFSTAGPQMSRTFGRANWFGFQSREHLAAREGVAMFDQSSFAKILVSGRDASSWLERVCSARVGGADVPDGKIVYTALLNDAGGMESDLTVTRLAWDKYLLVTSTAQATRDLAWLRAQLDPTGEEFVTLTDVSGAYAVLSVMGPRSRELLQRCTSASLRNDDFVFGTSREIDVGYAIVRANRVTFVGELGWELYIPTEFAVGVYEKIHKESKGNGADVPDLGLVDGGYFAIDSLRLEKGYRSWGHELSPSLNPYEAGLGFAVALDKAPSLSLASPKGAAAAEGFKGQKALQAFKAALGSNSPARRIVSVVFRDPQAYPLGDEPLFRSGVLLGYLSSASWGHSIGRGVALALLTRPVDDNEPNSKAGADKAWVEQSGVQYEVEIHGVKWAVDVSLQAPYDPKSSRVKM